MAKKLSLNALNSIDVQFLWQISCVFPHFLDNPLRKGPVVQLFTHVKQIITIKDIALFVPESCMGSM